MPKIPKLKLKVLIGFAAAFGFVAYFGIWAFMATVFTLWATSRVLGAILRFGGAVLGGTWQILNGRGPVADKTHYLLFKKRF